MSRREREHALRRPTRADYYQVKQYHEKTLQQRLEMLYQRNLYHLAIELAQNSGMDGKQRNVIFKKFGDFLYQKGNYDEAMTQYIKAIDSTEPSQVIRKFLDTQRIHNLIEYLEELHEHHKATSDHTTLLLNCYAKLKDIDKLEKFIKSEGDLKFDLDTAISMCRQGGYFEQAAYLAKKHGEHDMVVDILIEDSKQYEAALNFIWHLDPSTVSAPSPNLAAPAYQTHQAYPCLMRYARVLIEHCPDNATQLFIDYYTGKYQPRVEVAAPVEEVPVPVSGGFAAGAGKAVQNLSNLLPLPYMNTSAVVSPATQGNVQPTVADAQLVVDPKDQPAPDYTPPAPRTAFSSFIDRPDEFIVFLEACLQEDTLDESEKTDLNTTLFEMYLHKSAEKKGNAHRETYEAKAKALLSSPDQPPLSSSSVLLLSHLSSFRAGTTLVKEQSGLLFDIFRSYTSAKDTRGALKALHKYGPQEPQLYPAALAYLTSSPKILDEAGPDELAAVLERIDKDRLLAPLQVIQTLSKNDVATMGMLKPYLNDTIARERADIASNRRRAISYRAETDQRRQEIADLASRPAVFQATRCSQCAQALELPAVHFLCKHSFHQRCLKVGAEGGEGECPLCAQGNATVRAIRRQQEEYAMRHDLFKGEVEASEDRWGTMAEWFQRGVMGAGTAE
jgi:vacuolar protein sorting-associated protein 11